MLVSLRELMANPDVQYPIEEAIAREMSKDLKLFKTNAFKQSLRYAVAESERGKV